MWQGQWRRRRISVASIKHWQPDWHGKLAEACFFFLLDSFPGTETTFPPCCSGFCKTTRSGPACTSDRFCVCLHYRCIDPWPCFRRPALEEEKQWDRSFSPYPIQTAAWKKKQNESIGSQKKKVTEPLLCLALQTSSPRAPACIPLGVQGCNALNQCLQAKAVHGPSKHKACL